MRTKIYEVYGCIGDAEIFIGSSDLIQIISHAVLDAIDRADEISLEMAAAFAERSMEVRNSHG